MTPIIYIYIAQGITFTVLVLLALVILKIRRNIDNILLNLQNQPVQIDLISKQIHEKQTYFNQELQKLALDVREQQKHIQTILYQQFKEWRQEQTEQLQQQQKILAQGIYELKLSQQTSFNDFKEQLQLQITQHREMLNKHQIEALTGLQEHIQKQMQDIRIHLTSTLSLNAESIAKQLDKLTQLVHEQLQIISGQVEKRLSEGFEKTTATFTDVLKRLALIDEAQKRITELSSDVVSLQEILADKRSRGVFGEIQLSILIRNVMPPSSFEFQYTLSNNKRADCILFLPEPTGKIVIDAKFPLESYQKMMDIHLPETDRRLAEQTFRQDIRKHIHDIAEKYIISGETGDGAIMFIPAEAVFAEIHAHYPDLVEIGFSMRVWMASPTTMMAILTTARAVIKDEDTRKQVHVIQEHLTYLAKDFDRFRNRMENLAKHIDQANEDVKDVHISARKITERFKKIEKVELEGISCEAEEEVAAIVDGDESLE